MSVTAKNPDGIPSSQNPVSQQPGNSKPAEQLEGIAIRFAGDSGDGMQLTGTRFSDETALAGNDLSTFPDFPAEIRAPAGTMAGVSGFQIHFSSIDIHTPADQPDVLIAFNPAALRANVDDVRPMGMVIVNIDSFNQKSLTRAGYGDDPLPELRERFQVVEVPFTTLNRAALQGLDLSQREIDRCKNFFALGVLCWLYGRPMDATERWLGGKFKGDVLEGNIRTLRAGHAFGETTEIFPASFVIPAAKIAPGTYRNITGNQALAWGIVAAGVQMERNVFLGAYPITPASDVLHEVARYRHFGVKTFQAEDEMAAVSSTIGAAFAGQLAVTVSSGPGFVLKQEALGLAVMVELPLVAINVQRAGPSTGSPTKTEQGDLLAVLFGRHSESPIPIIAPCTPGDCFHAALEAFRMAVKYMTPVIVLSDGYLANSSEPWLIPEVDSLARNPVKHAHPADIGEFQPYARDPETLARPWAIPGTKGLEHRIGGLTKEDKTGNVIYDADNHGKMNALRKAKIEGIAKDYAPIEIDGPPEGEILVIGWGGTLGAITAAVESVREEGLSVSRIHLRHLNPFPSDLGDILGRFEKVLLPELSDGHLALLLRAKYLVDVRSLTKTEGQPFKIAELTEAIHELHASEN
ncbi:MAG TPA: 2-oxoacid:acceptor oxidoreductase subunit alpha [Myxococcales bacterium]|nr:2-oxoacid:acceptor oxidoreductase subunit alpha [Myxococcales bacterium]HIK86681.1 2-oxoacid:acceptor oxidoreductase subunit alpha [Myxococcales bacterium]